MLLYVLIFAFISVCYAGCGVFKAPSGSVYNLNPLTRSIDYTGKEQSTTYTYYYNYCQYVNQTALRLTCTQPTYVAQVSLTGTCTEIGSTPANITEIAKDQGVIIRYQDNVNLCGNPRTIPRKSILTLTCDPSVEYNLLKPGVCQYAFYVQTKYACPVQPFNKSDCCEPQANPGCADPAVEACVCKNNPECCNSAWDSTCVALVEKSGCGDCKLGKCCDVHRGKGCEDRSVSTCVCENMEECCTNEWTSDCVTAVNKYNCGQCTGTCCVAAPCTDAKVRDCVCKRDVYCCYVEWDATCVQEAQRLNCTYCSSATPRPFLPRTPLVN